MFASFMSGLWSILSIVAEVISVGLLIALVDSRFRQNKFSKFFHEKSLIIAFIISFLATAGSLIYSNVIGYAPCELCWFQRIFMYPQIILMSIAFVRKDTWMKLYGVILSIIGGAIALFHYMGQLGWTSLPCPAVGVSVSCSQRFVMAYGYITIPMMAFSAFMLIALTLLLSIKKDKEVISL